MEFKTALCEVVIMEAGPIAASVPATQTVGTAARFCLFCLGVLQRQKNNMTAVSVSAVPPRSWP